MVASGEPRRVVDEFVELLFGSRSSHLSAPAAAAAAAANGKSVHSLTPQQRFAAQACAGDNCPARTGYNAGETRIGDRSVEIIDYLVSTDKQSDVDVIHAGDHVQLLLKVRFHAPIARPVIGFAIKTVDGIEIYGTNTFLLAIAVAQAAPGDVRVFAFAFSMIAKAGDYFVDLGVAQVDGTPGGAVIDVRRSAVHLVVVAERAGFTGLADFMPEFTDFGVARQNTGEVGLAAGQLS
jgi:lipopolysaccharide transport system ATP-binding protein